MKMMLKSLLVVLWLIVATSTVVMAQVTYFDKDKVAAAFAKGAVLAEAKDYAVHASRRDRPGIPELHEKDVDIMYVLDGSAIVVTGGELVDAKTIATGEIRGTDIKGGESRRLGKGDIIIIPAGTPHWFKEVHVPLTYYVVKTR